MNDEQGSGDISVVVHSDFDFVGAWYYCTQHTHGELTETMTDEVHRIRYA